MFPSKLSAGYLTAALVRSLLVAEWSIVADFIRTPNGIPPFAASHKISRPSSRQYGGGGADLYHPRNNPILNTFNTNIGTFQILPTFQIWLQTFYSSLAFQIHNRLCPQHKIIHCSLLCFCQDSIRLLKVIILVQPQFTSLTGNFAGYGCVEKI